MSRLSLLSHTADMLLEAWEPFVDAIRELPDDDPLRVAWSNVDWQSALEVFDIAREAQRRET